MTHPTIGRNFCRALAARLEGKPYVEEWNFSGCALYEGGCRCGKEVVETLVPIYGDGREPVPVCIDHLEERQRDHLLVL